MKAAGVWKKMIICAIAYWPRTFLVREELQLLCQSKCLGTKKIIIPSTWNRRRSCALAGLHRRSAVSHQEGVEAAALQHAVNLAGRRHLLSVPGEGPASGPVIISGVNRMKRNGGECRHGYGNV